ncbi:MAG: type II toxin-antitoxin system VapC family toxin [Verrucomicrobiota bacterium]|nr:type II toxin-antitoxin system VapC family toxin [Verrucomicrobiota bacterium]
MLLVDTNLIVPLFVRTAGSDVARDLLEFDGLWRTEPLALIEFSNVLATYQRSRHITAATARDCLARAESWLRPLLFSIRHEAALDLAIRYKVTACDARFLALADELGGRLVTEDARLRAAAPSLTQSIRDALVSA